MALICHSSPSALPASRLPEKQEDGAKTQISLSASARCLLCIIFNHSLYLVTYILPSTVVACPLAARYGLDFTNLQPRSQATFWSKSSRKVPLTGHSPLKTKVHLTLLTTVCSCFSLSPYMIVLWLRCIIIRILLL